MTRPPHNSSEDDAITVLTLNSEDAVGGAARAAYRMHTALQGVGVDSKMLVGIKWSNDPSVVRMWNKYGRLRLAAIGRLDLLPFGYSWDYGREFSVGWLEHGATRKLRQWPSSIVHVHWIGRGFLPIRALGRLNRPVVFTLHDTWAFTGGCHYPQDCTRYRDSCGSCPYLSSTGKRDLSRWVLKTKKKAWKVTDLTVVAPSKWIAKCAESSSLLRHARIVVIPNCLDTRVFKPLNKVFAREVFNFGDKQIILAGGWSIEKDARKGFDLLQTAMKHLASRGLADRATLVVFGAPQSGDNDYSAFQMRQVGHLHDDESLATCYSAADIFVAPSRQDNLPNTVMEAMACGTPCVAFDIGGMADMIEHKKNGYLARPFDVHDLAYGISWVLEDEERRRALAQAAEHFEMITRAFFFIFLCLTDPARFFLLRPSKFLSGFSSPLRIVV